MDIKFQFGDMKIKFWRWLHMNSEKQYILHSISLSTQKEKIIIQQTPQLWNKLCHSQTATQKHVLTASLKHRCLPVISSLTYFMNYKLWTWKRLFCYQYSSDTLFTNLKGSIVPPLPECDLKCQITVFYSLHQTKFTVRKVVFCTKYLQGPWGLSACSRTQKEARRQGQGMPACVRRRSRTRTCECL